MDPGGSAENASSSSATAAPPASTSLVFEDFDFAGLMLAVDHSQQPHPPTSASAFLASAFAAAAADAAPPPQEASAADAVNAATANRYITSGSALEAGSGPPALNSHDLINFAALSEADLEALTLAAESNFADPMPQLATLSPLIHTAVTNSSSSSGASLPHHYFQQLLLLQQQQQQQQPVSQSSVLASALRPPPITATNSSLSSATTASTQMTTTSTTTVTTAASSSSLSTVMLASALSSIASSSSSSPPSASPNATTSLVPSRIQSSALLTSRLKRRRSAMEGAKAITSRTAAAAPSVDQSVSPPAASPITAPFPFVRPGPKPAQPRIHAHSIPQAHYSSLGTVLAKASLVSTDSPSSSSAAITTSSTSSSRDAASSVAPSSSSSVTRASSTSFYSKSSGAGSGSGSASRLTELSFSSVVEESSGSSGSAYGSSTGASHSKPLVRSRLGEEAGPQKQRRLDVMPTSYERARPSEEWSGMREARDSGVGASRAAGAVGGGSGSTGGSRARRGGGGTFPPHSGSHLPTFPHEAGFSPPGGGGGGGWPQDPLTAALPPGWIHVRVIDGSLVVPLDLLSRLGIPYSIAGQDSKHTGTRPTRVGQHQFQPLASPVALFAHAAYSATSAAAAAAATSATAVTAPRANPSSKVDADVDTISTGSSKMEASNASSAENGVGSEHHKSTDTESELPISSGVVSGVAEAGEAELVNDVAGAAAATRGTAGGNVVRRSTVAEAECDSDGDQQMGAKNARRPAASGTAKTAPVSTEQDSAPPPAQGGGDDEALLDDADAPPASVDGSRRPGLALDEDDDDASPVEEIDGRGLRMRFYALTKREMELLLHWLRYGGVPQYTRADLDLLGLLSDRYGLRELMVAVRDAKDTRYMSIKERAEFDGKAVGEMQRNLGGLMLFPDPARTNEGEGTVAATIAGPSYQAVCAVLDDELWDLAPSTRKLVRVDFRFPLAMARQGAISPFGSDQVRELQGQPGWDSMASSSSGRQTLWNTYRDDANRQVWHRIFFDTVAKRLWTDGFVIEREMVDCISSKVFYLVSR